MRRGRAWRIWRGVRSDTPGDRQHAAVGSRTILEGRVGHSLAELDVPGRWGPVEFGVSGVKTMELLLENDFGALSIDFKLLA